MKNYENGVYFDMPDDEYHAIPRLSASGIKNMLTSPATFWAYSWLNRDRKKYDETLAQKIGKAYHCARLEPESFYDRYCRSISKDDYGPDLISTDADVQAALKSLGEVQKKSGETALDRANRLKNCLGFTGQIWSLEVADFESETEGKTKIPSEIWNDLIKDMDRFHKCRDVSELLYGGHSEVTILWTCPDTAIAMKARLDFLSADRIVELKTFSNSNQKPLDQEILDAFRYNRYYIQAAVYYQAVEIIRKTDLDVVGCASDAQKSTINQIKASQTPADFWFIFQEKAGVPNLVARKIEFMIPPIGMIEQQINSPSAAYEMAKLSRPSALFMKSQQEIYKSKEDFMRYTRHYQSHEPWSELFPIGKISDQDFSDFWLGIEQEEIY